MWWGRERSRAAMTVVHPLLRSKLYSVYPTKCVSYSIYPCNSSLILRNHFSLFSSYRLVHWSTSCVGLSFPASYMGTSLRDLPRVIPGQVLPDSEFRFLKTEPEPTPSYYIETYVCILLNLLLCMSPRDVIYSLHPSLLEQSVLSSGYLI